MATTSITPIIPSGSTNGRGILIAATSTPGTLIHTATGVTGEMDEVTLFANNSDTVDRLLTVQLGGTTSPNDLVQYTIPPKSGWNLVVSGQRLNGSVVVRAFAATTNVISVWAQVNRIVAT